MVQNEQDLDLDIDNAAKGGGGWKKLVLFGLIGTLLIAVSVTTTLLLLKDDGDTAGASEAATNTGGEQAKPAEKKTPVYLSLDPPFVVNLNDDSGVRFLQVQVSVMTYSQEALDKVELHMPMVRHYLVLLFSSQSFSELKTREGKEKLQKAALETVRQALTEATGQPLVEQVFLPSIVGQ